MKGQIQSLRRLKLPGGLLCDSVEDGFHDNIICLLVLSARGKCVALAHLTTVTQTNLVMVGQMVTGWIQTIYYGITIRAGDPKPLPGTPRYTKHRQRIQITVIVIYLLYTIFEADYWIRKNGDFFQHLGLTPSAGEKQIKSKFRRLAALHHPDKIQQTFGGSSGNNQQPPASEAADAYFVLLKSAQDTLSDPVKRFAYTRFGPEVLTWQHCSTYRDYLVRGLQVSNGPLYAGSLMFMVLLGFTGYMQQGRYWRYIMFAALVVLEIHMLTRPHISPVLETVINPALETITTHPPLLPFQLVQLARKATFTFFIAVSQIGSLFPPDPLTSNNNRALSQQEMQQLVRLEQSVKGMEAETSRLLAMDTAPFVGDEQGTKELSNKVREWLVTNTIRADPEVRDAMGRAMVRRRADAPAGARPVISAN